MTDVVLDWCDVAPVFTCDPIKYSYEHLPFYMSQNVYLEVNNPKFFTTNIIDDQQTTNICDLNCYFIDDDGQPTEYKDLRFTGSQLYIDTWNPRTGTFRFKCGVVNPFNKYEAENELKLTSYSTPFFFLAFFDVLWVLFFGVMAVVAFFTLIGLAFTLGLGIPLYIADGDFKTPGLFFIILASMCPGPLILQILLMPVIGVPHYITALIIQEIGKQNLYCDQCWDTLLAQD